MKPSLKMAPLAAPGTACGKCNTTAGVRLYNTGAFHPDHAPADSLPLTKEAYQQITETCEQLQGVVKKLPAKVFEGTNLRGRLARTCTVDGAKVLVVAFAELLYRKRSWLEQAAANILSEIRGIIGRIAKTLDATHLVASYGF